MFGIKKRSSQFQLVPQQTGGCSSPTQFQSKRRRCASSSAGGDGNLGIMVPLRSGGNKRSARDLSPSENLQFNHQNGFGGNHSSGWGEQHNAFSSKRSRG